MHAAYFPDPLFAWSFLVVLGVILLIAAWIDLRTMKVPKWLTLSALAAGVLVNLLRGLLLGLAEQPVWLLGTNGPVVGSMDGLLLSLAGFGAAFSLYFCLWLLNICGGGDVKIAAAVGAWLGPVLVLWVFVATIFTVAVVAFCILLGRLLSGKGMRIPSATAAVAAKKKAAHVQPKQRALAFSLPLALACLLVLPWLFRFDLQLAPRPATGHSQVRLIQP